MKRSLIAGFLFFFAGAVFGLDISFFTPAKPDIYITQTFDYNMLYDTRSQNTGFSTTGVVDAKELLVTGGFSGDSKRTDIAIQGYYGPCWWHLVTLGVSTKYHYYKYQDVFAEYNFQDGLFVRFNFSNSYRQVWNIYANMLYMWKLTVINTYPSNIKLTERSLSLATGCSFCIDDLWKFYLNIESSSLFDDALLGSPMIDTGFMRNIWQCINCGASLFMKWTDASILKDSFSVFGVRMNWTLKF